MSVDSSWELQKAIYGALTGDSTLMAMITGVHDHVPQETAFPYVTVPGHVLVWFHFEFSQTLQDADGATYHGIARYNAITHEA